MASTARSAMAAPPQRVARERNESRLQRIARQLRAMPITVTSGERAIPVAVGRAKLALEALRNRRIAVIGQYEAGIISRAARDRQLHDIGEKRIPHERMLRRYRGAF